jgi:predicted PurR-regulated permease PerM
MERSDVESPARAGRYGMPPWVPRLLATIAGIVVVLFATYHVLRRLRGLLILILISLFLSIALEPGVNWLSRRGWRRGVATGAIFLLLIVVLGLFVGLMVPLVIDQVARFIDNVPRYIDEIAAFADRFGVEFSGERLQPALTGIDSDLQRIAGDVAGSVFGVGTALLGTVLQLLAIGLFTFYMTADGPRLRRAVLSVLPEARQREVLRVIDVAIDKTGGYFYSRALLAGISASVTWATLTIIGVPFPLALALWFGLISQFVPVVGTYIGGAIPLLVALVESPARAIAVLVYVLVYQGIENYVLAPKITARTMSLHPAVAFGSAIAGGTLLGVPGALMALPTAATIQAFASTYFQRHAVVESPLTEDRRRARAKGAEAAEAAEGGDAPEEIEAPDPG